MHLFIICFNSLSVYWRIVLIVAVMLDIVVLINLLVKFWYSKTFSQ